MKRLVSYFVSITVVFHSSLAQAGGIPVIDAANLAQSILTAVRTLQSNVNEATMIINQLRNLELLPFSVLDQYRQQYTELFAAVGEIQGLMQDYQNLEAKFEELYPDYLHLGDQIKGEKVREFTDRWLTENREMMLGVAKTGAQVMKDLPTQHANTGRLVQESQKAVGILQATQAGNQMLAQVSGGLSSLNLQLAQYSQAMTTFMSKQISNESLVKNRMDHILDGYDPGNQKRVPMNPF